VTSLEFNLYNNLELNGTPCPASGMFCKVGSQRFRPVFPQSSETTTSRFWFEIWKRGAGGIRCILDSSIWSETVRKLCLQPLITRFGFFKDSSQLCFDTPTRFLVGIDSGKTLAAGDTHIHKSSSVQSRGDTFLEVGMFLLNCPIHHPNSRPNSNT